LLTVSAERPTVRCMGRHTAEELEIIELIQRMQDRRLTAAEAAIALVQAFAIDELSEPPDDMPAWDVDASPGGKLDKQGAIALGRDAKVKERPVALRSHEAATTVGCRKAREKC
jgi:hypothetical protein